MFSFYLAVKCCDCLKSKHVILPVFSCKSFIELVLFSLAVNYLWMFCLVSLHHGFLNLQHLLISCTENIQVAACKDLEHYQQEEAALLHMIKYLPSSN